MFVFPSFCEFRQGICRRKISNVNKKRYFTFVKTSSITDAATAQCDVRKVVVAGGYDCMLDPEMKVSAGSTYWFVFIGYN